MGLIHTITEGGQIWNHRFRMFKQVLKTTLSSSFCIGLAVLIALVIREPMADFNSAWYYSKSYILGSYFKKISVESKYWETATGQRFSQESIEVPANQLSRITEKQAKTFLDNVLKSVDKAVLISNIAFVAMLFFFLFFGLKSKAKEQLSGKKISSPIFLALKLYLKRKASKIKIGFTPLLKDSESQHLLITGGTGTGKTNCLHHLLKQIRNLGHKAIIVDTTGTFVNRYFCEDTDFILSPHHHQRVKWHPWAECENSVDYAGIAEAFIPHSNNDHDNYWRIASRSFFSTLLQKLGDTKKTSEIVKWTLFEPLETVCELLKGTKAASHMDIRAEKTASSVRSVASTYLECLETLEDTESPFSIKKWIAEQKHDSWLFLQCSPTERSSVRPLLSAWTSSAIRGLMALEPDNNRKIWFILDELPSLQKVKDIETLLTEGRKYGGCCILSLQSPAQLESIYGREITKTILGNTLTKIVFAEQDPEIASKISQAFGEQEIKERQEGISYGAHEARDGVNLSSHRSKSSLVSASLIMSLPKHTAYIKLPENYPIVKQKLKFAL